MLRRLKIWLKRLVFAGLIMGLLGAAAFVVLWHLFPFPQEKLDWPARGAVVTDRTGGALLELVGEDQQWRRPITLSEISPWVIQAVVAAEDKRFFDHGGIDGRAAARAAWQDLTSVRIVSGASTLTMQVCRMMDDRPRTPWAKGLEAFRALQLERLRSKEQILEAYLNQAPFGGNVRGIEAAARRYFAKSARDLSLGEAALLAGLPQSPARLRPDRHPLAARARRDEVLRRMAALGVITSDQCATATAEEPALVPSAAPGLAPHAAAWALARRPSGGQTTIDPDMQREVERLAALHVPALPPGSDLAVVVIDLASADILALVGSAEAADPAKGQVNGALTRRSPGSALKPFVYAAAFEARRLAPASTVYDGPITRAGWSPADFDRVYVGTTTAADALRRSLNVPAIVVAEGVGLSRCLGLMQEAGVDLGPDPAARSGLSVVVGTAEVRLLDLTNAYATLGRGGVRREPRLFLDEKAEPLRLLDADVCAAVDDILSSRGRVPRGMEDLAQARVPWFMWKTGTSSGRRDAWAVGHNGRVAIGVWVGAFAGQGRAEYLGREAAEPLLARLFAAPLLRRTDPDPAPPATWQPHRLVGAPEMASDQLRITSPSAGAAFIAVGGSTIVHPQANRPSGLQWFLNGLVVEPAKAERLVLQPGRFELRCVDDAGQSSAVRFEVR